MQVINNYCTVCNLYLGTDFYANGLDRQEDSHGYCYVHMREFFQKLKQTMGLDKIVEEEEPPNEFQTFWASAREVSPEIRVTEVYDKWLAKHPKQFDPMYIRSMWELENGSQCQNEY